MGIELRILGIRKIRDEEIEELFGKTEKEIEECQYFRTFFPKAPYGSRYWCFSQDEINQYHHRSVLHMMTPVLDSQGKERYVFWVEKLGYYWHKNPDDRMRIEELIFDDRIIIDWDQSFHVVPYDQISCFMDGRPMVKNKREEIIAFLYG